MLAIWGTSDWLVDRAANAWIAEVVNRVKPGNGTFVALDSIDHFFFRTATPEESYRYFKPAKGMPPTEFNPVILERYARGWMRPRGERRKGRRTSQPLPRGDRFAGMDAYIRAAMEKWEVPGLAIAVVKDGEMVLARGYGVCEIGKDRKVTADTAFTIASCAKSFMAACRGHAGRGRETALGRSGREASAGFRAFRSLPDGARHAARSVVSSHGLAAGRLAGDGAGFDAQEILRRLKHLEPMRRTCARSSSTTTTCTPCWARW